MSERERSLKDIAIFIGVDRFQALVFISLPAIEIVLLVKSLKTRSAVHLACTDSHFRFLISFFFLLYSHVKLTADKLNFLFEKSLKGE